MRDKVFTDNIHDVLKTVRGEEGNVPEKCGCAGDLKGRSKPCWGLNLALLGLHNLWECWYNHKTRRRTMSNYWFLGFWLTSMIDTPLVAKLLKALVVKLGTLNCTVLDRLQL